MNREITGRAGQHWAVAVALSLGVASAQSALTEGRTTDGHRYVAGGIGTEEVDALRQEAPSFSLQLVTAARSGAYLARTQIRILGQSSNVVLDTTIDAPWLLVDLPSGRYTLQATHEGKTIERRLNIGAGKPQRLVLHFDAPVDGTTGSAPSDTGRPAVPQ